MRISAVTVLAAALLAPHAQAATPNIKEGQWEISMTMEIPGMPKGGMPPQVMRQCITKKDLTDPRKPVPGGKAGDSRCKMTDHKMQGNTATWKVACEDGTSGIGTATYSSTSYTSTNTITSKRGGQAQTMTMHQNGRYLGTCKKP